jgi:hypothetical protein
VVLTKNVLLLALVSADCGDDATPTRDSGPVLRDGGGGRDGGPRSDGGDSDAGGATDGGADAEAGDAGEPGGTVMLTEFVAYSNCMPAIPPDPVIAWWTASISDGSGPTARLTSATLTISAGDGVMQELTVDMPVIALIDGAGSAMQRKVSGMPALTGACERVFCDGPRTAEIEVVFDIGGANATTTASTEFGCVY